MVLQERTSGITLKAVTNPRFAVSHDERTDLTGADYLLPAEFQLGNRVIEGSMSENEIADLFIRRKANLSGQAKAKGASPFTEGVAVLPAIGGGPADKYIADNEKNLKILANAIKEKYGVRVLHMSIHLDEGKYFPETGKIHYNPHAHIIIDRTLENGKLLGFNKAGLAGLQTLVADSLKMKRGLTVQERGGKPSRANIDHRTYREIIEKNGDSVEFAKRLQYAADEISAERAENAMLRAKIEKANVDFARLEEKRRRDIFKAFMIGTKKAKAKDYREFERILKEDQPFFDTLCDQIEFDENVDSDAILWCLRGGDMDLYNESKQESSGTFADKSGLAAPHLSDDSVIDPLIRWNKNGQDLYLLPERDEKKGRLAFRDSGDRIDVRLGGDKTIKCALLLAHEKWPKGPIVVDGDPAFVKRSIELGRERGIIVQPAQTHLATSDERDEVDQIDLLKGPGGPGGPSY